MCLSRTHEQYWKGRKKKMTVISFHPPTPSTIYAEDPFLHHTELIQKKKKKKKKKKKGRKKKMTVITEEMKAKAEVYHGDELGQEKTKYLLQEVGLPRGLLPLKDIIECGYVEETGFVWLKQKSKVEHTFDKIGKQVSYATEITAYVEKFKIKKLKGVKVKELMMWLTLCEIDVDDPPTGKLTCRTPSGLFRVFPTAAFELPEDLLLKQQETTGAVPNTTAVEVTK